MSLTTRCPSCATEFRVTPSQLQARRGTVRCGRCSTVFNALDNLTALPDAPETQNTVSAPATVEPPRSPFAEEPAAFDTAHLDLDLSDSAPAEAIPAAAPSGDPETPAARDPEPAEGTAPLALADQEIALLAAQARRRQAMTWGAGALVLLVLLLGQIAYLLRSEAAASRPALRPILEAACSVFGCTVPLPRRPDQWSIDSSDLQAEPGRVNVMTLSAVLRNRASYAQAYPALELTLEDTAGRPVGRRTLTADDYLPRGADVRRGAVANGEIVVRLTLDTGALSAAGYRLYLFYPPLSPSGQKSAGG